MARALPPPGFVRKAPEQSERGAGDRDRTLSRSCPTQKSKNFVSRARSRPPALRGLFPLGPERELGRAPRPPRHPRQRRHAVLARGQSAVLACATATAATLPTNTRNRTGAAPDNTGNGSPNTSEKKQKHRNSLRETVAAPWAGFWTGLGHDAGAATVPTEPPPGGVNLGRVLADGRVQRVMFLFRNGPFDAPRLLTLYRPLHWPQPATISPWITARNREPPTSGFAIL